LKVRFRNCNTTYSGIVRNLSKNGLLINVKEMCFPFESEFEILMYVHNDILNIPVKLLRIQMSPHGYDGLGVELIDPPQKYIDFIERIRSS
jgi:hypothetical protein